MEKFIIGLFTEQLSTYIKGFNKDQVNANLLNGKGEVKDIHVNVDPINELLRQYTNLVELSSVYVSKLSFNVTSFRNIKKAPIEISIDEVHVIVVESLAYQAFNEFSWPELAKSIVEKANKNGPYGLLERIQDNITVDMNRVYMTFQPMGKFKTRKIGPWTPPAISVVLNNFRFVMVDEYGNEGSPDDVWRHNSRGGKQEAKFMMRGGGKNDRTYRPKTFMIYKKVSMDLSVAIGHRTSQSLSAKDTFLASKLLVANLPLQTHVCIHRDLRRKSILAVQIDVSLMSVEVEIDPDIINLLLHALIGIQHCTAKDRSFIDPFDQEEGASEGLDDGSIYDTYQVLGDAEKQEIVGDGVDDGAIEPDEFEDSVADDMSFSMMETEDGTESLDASMMQSQHDTDTVIISANGDESWPALVMPAGLIIVEKIAFSLSVNHIGIRICYPSENDGFLQVIMKGFMTELIWPKEGPPDRLGGYIQASLAFASVHETLNRSTRQIFLGGHQCVDHGDKSGTETTSEEMFPIFESSMIRNDPVDLRSTFPVHLFAWKSSIDVLDKTNILKSTSRLSIMNEIGLNNVHFTLLPDVCFRLFSLAKKQMDCIDSRWNSGDWGDEAALGDDIDIQSCLQPLPIVEVKKIEEILSQVVNVTTRVCNFNVQIAPFDAKDNFKCGNILFALTESTAIFSPSLPRLFFSEAIPSHMDTGKNTDGNLLTFPNAPSDDFVGNALDASNYKKFRAQVTLIGASLMIEPTIPYYGTYDAKKLIKLDKLTILGSYEMPDEELQNSTDGDVHVHLFLSTLVQVAEINIDFDNLASAVATANSYRPLVKSDESPVTSLTTTNLTQPFNLVIRSSITRLNVLFWKQNMSQIDIYDETIDPRSSATLLLRLCLEEAELGLQFNLVRGDSDTLVAGNISQGSLYSIIAKGAIGKLQLLTTITENQIKSLPENHSINNDSKTQEPNSNAESLHEHVLLSFGSDETDEIFMLFRLEKDTNPRDCLNVSLEISKGEIFANDAILQTIFHLVEAVIHPEWECLIPHSHQVKATEEYDTVSDDEGNDTDIRLQLLSSMLQTKADLIDFVNVRLQFKNVSLFVPYEQAHDKELVLVADKISIFTAYIPKGGVPKPYDDAWETGIFRDREPGFHHRFSSVQKISISHSREDSTHSQVVVKPFSAEMYYHPSKFLVSSSNFSFSLDELSVWEALQKTALVYKGKVETLKIEVEEALTSFMKKVDTPFSTTRHQHIDTDSSPIAAICLKSLEEIKNAKKMLEEARISLSSQEKIFQAAFTENKIKLDTLHRRLFSQQKDFIAAYSLVSHRMSGFIKMSGTNAYSQRFISTSINFWEYFGVIKNDSFFLFKDTSQAKPMFIIPLKNAKVNNLTGSGAKRTFSRAFAIVTPSGEKNFFIARNYVEFEKWITALKPFTTDPDTSSSKIPATQNESSNGGLVTPPEEGLDSVMMTDDQLLSNENSDITDVNLIDASSMSGEVIGDINQHPDDSLHDLEDESVSQYSSTFDDADGEIPEGRRAKFRHRMSKFSDAVKNVKLDKNPIRNRNGMNALAGPRNSVFRRQQGATSKSDTNTVGKVLRLKQVRDVNEEPSVKEKIQIEKGQLIVQFPGTWSVSVSIEIRSNIPSQSPETPDTEGQSKATEVMFTFDLAHDLHISDEKPNVWVLEKELTEIIRFHADISQNLVAIQNDPVAADLDIDGSSEIFSHLIHSGEMLGGVLNFLGDRCDEKPKFLASTGKSTSDFFKALLSYPLPTTVSTKVANFLDIHNMAIEIGTTKTGKSDDSEKIPTQVSSKEVFELLDNCASAISKAERQTNRAQRLTKMALKISSDTNSTSRPQSSSEGVNKIIQNALLSVMTERDEALSQLVASRVLHTHEMDQQKRKTEVLDTKLKYKEELDNQESAAAAAFFLGQEKLPELNPMTEIEKNMVQSVDAELLALCRQLSSEISLKVAAELEVIRLKESRKIEREFEMNQRKNLEQQLAYYKRKADEESVRSRVAMEEKEKWRQSFEHLMEKEN